MDLNRLAYEIKNALKGGGQPLGKKSHAAFSHRVENKTKSFMKGSIYLLVVLKLHVALWGVICTE